MITCTNDQYRVSIKTTLMTAKPAHPMPTLDSPAQSLTESLCFPSILPRIRSQHNTPRIDTCQMYFSSFPILIFMSYLAICIFLKDCQMSIMIYFHILFYLKCFMLWNYNISENIFYFFHKPVKKTFTLYQLYIWAPRGSGRWISSEDEEGWVLHLNKQNPKNKQPNQNHCCKNNDSYCLYSLRLIQSISSQYN